MSAFGAPRLPQLDLVGDIPGGQYERFPVGHVALADAADGQRAIVVAEGDLPPVSVLHPRPPCRQGAVVAAGDDEIPDACRCPVVKEHPYGFDATGVDEVGASALVQFRDGFTVPGDHQRGQACRAVYLPRGVQGIEHLVEPATVQPLLKRMDAHWRLARHYGIANMLIFHKLTDLDNVGDQGSAMRSLANSLLANAETRIVYRQESDQLGATAQALGLTGTEQRLLPGLGVGQGLWRIKDRSFVTQHQLHPAELELFRTDARYLQTGRGGGS